MDIDLRIKLHKLFEVVTEFVYESGGDGDGWIISWNYKALAAEFEMWQKGKGWNGSDHFPQRDEGADSVGFSDNQESVTFVKDRSGVPDWGPDIVIEASHFDFV